jgi:hypothetical protein
MDKVDQVDSVEKPKRGRPPKAKEDLPTPQGQYRIDDAKNAKDRKEKQYVVEKYYELCGVKLSYCRRVASGTVHKVLVGSTTDKAKRDEIAKFIEKLKKEGRLRIKV